MSDGVREKTRQEMCKEINELISENAKYKVQTEVLRQERNDAIQKFLKEKSELEKELREVKSENEKAMKQIAHDQAKIGDLLNEIDSKRSEIMPDEPIKAAERLIHATVIRETNAILRMFRRSERYETYDLYSVSDLRQIAEHLLVYCNNNESDSEN